MQKTAYEVRISDWSADGCSSDLGGNILVHIIGKGELQGGNSNLGHPLLRSSRSKSRDGNMCIFAYIRRARCNCSGTRHLLADAVKTATAGQYGIAHQSDNIPPGKKRFQSFQRRLIVGLAVNRHYYGRSEEHTSELQSL